MKITDAFPSRFIKSDDLQGRTITLTIEDVDLEELEGERKPVMRFKGKQKGLVLNRINSQVLAAAFGDETENWRGRQVELFSTKVSFQGRLVDGLRLRAAGPAAVRTATATAAETTGMAAPRATSADDLPFDDDLTF